jgi:hypothetical protein
MASTGTRSLSVLLSHSRERDGSGNAHFSVLLLALEDYELYPAGMGTQILDLRRGS